MDIELKHIRIGDLAKGYQDNDDMGVFGYGGKLDIRPAYQREFVYNEKQRNEVIKTVSKGFPLNVMYWSVSDSGDFEIIDGQQRTISICQFINNDFSVEFDGRALMFHSLPDDLQKAMLDYELTVYQCKGEDSEKLDWFQTINIAGVELTKQELRNAVYTGKWVTEAKKYFSKRQNPAQQLYGDYLSGASLRQEFLEIALDWISHRNGESIEEYMTKHQHDDDASELWQYFKSVMAWLENVFSNHSKERLKLMKGQKWGYYYNTHKDDIFNAQKLEQRIVELITDKEVDNKKGIYAFLLTGQEKHLSLRTFDDKEKHEMYAGQEGICLACKEHFDYDKMEADHIVPWSQGGKTTIENGQMLCKPCNRTKSDK